MGKYLYVVCSSSPVPVTPAADTASTFSRLYKFVGCCKSFRSLSPLSRTANPSSTAGVGVQGFPSGRRTPHLDETWYHPIRLRPFSIRVCGCEPDVGKTSTTKSLKSSNLCRDESRSKRTQWHDSRKHSLCNRKSSCRCLTLTSRRR